jgi:thiol-disulfide isomerase/thioredoxin
VQAETAEAWNGATPTDDGNRGRLDALAAADAGGRAGARLTVSLRPKVPLYTHVVGGQLQYPVVLGLAVSASRDVWGDPRPVARGHDEPAQGHGHDHGHDHGSGEAAGSALPVLVPEPGQITVFDFWASWCEPCEELADRLAKIPGLVIKRVDVSDAHLDFELPHLKVFGRDGRLLWERSGSAAELGAAAQKLVE